MPTPYKLLDAAGNVANPPTDVEETSGGYRNKADFSEDLQIQFSFFWPLESRYVWEHNRATGAASLDSFRLFYLPETSLFAPVNLKIQSNGPDGILALLDEVRPEAPGYAWKNAALFDLLRRLGATQAGNLEPAITQIALTGGKLQMVREFQVLSATLPVNGAAILLRMAPARDIDNRKSPAQDSFPLMDAEERSTAEIKGRLYWNTEAFYAGVRLGWRSMGLAGEKLVPTPCLDLHAALNIQNTHPNLPPDLMTDVPARAGLVGYPPPQVEGKFEFRITVAANDPLAGLERFLLTPLDSASGLEPGEFPAAALPPDSVETPPASAQVLFSTERLVSFQAVRLPPDQNNANAVVFRGEPLLYTSRPANNVAVKETLLFPDPLHADWRVVTPNTVVRNIHLAEFLGSDVLPPVKPFSAEHSLATSLTIAVETVAGADGEVRSSLQNATAVQKLVFQVVLPPPVFKAPDQSQPAFGIPAGRPGYNGISLISVRKVFENYDLDALLPADRQYFLHRLPADRVLTLPSPAGLPAADRLPVQYALHPLAGVYRRDMQVLRDRLNNLKSATPLLTNYLDMAELQNLFRDYGERGEQEPLDKEAFLHLPVSLPGESRTAFLFSIKAYDPASGKESETFFCLSSPVYVEDVTPPTADLATLVQVKRQDPDQLSIKVTMPRKLSAVDGYGYVAPDEFISRPDLLNSGLVHLTAAYRVYLTNDRDLAAHPGESDFVPLAMPGATYGGAAGPNPLRSFSLKLLPKALTTTPKTDQTELSGSVKFSAAYDLQNTSVEAYLCVRAVSYLGEMSPLQFMPIFIQE